MAVAAVLVIALLGLAPAASAHDHGKRVLRIDATTIQEQFLDLGAPGPSLGDELVFSERLYRNGRQAGESGGVCTLVQLVPPYTVQVFQCVATLSLRKGQITLQGLFELQGPSDPGPFTAAITGGTGAYRGASGEVRVRRAGDRTFYKLRLDRAKQHRRHHRH